MALLVVALITFIIKFCMFTIPTIKSRKNNENIALVCEILVFIGLAFALIGLFLPEGVLGADLTQEDSTGYKKLIAAVISG